MKTTSVGRCGPRPRHVKEDILIVMFIKDFYTAFKKKDELIMYMFCQAKPMTFALSKNNSLHYLMVC